MKGIPGKNGYLHTKMPIEFFKTMNSLASCCRSRVDMIPDNRRRSGNCDLHHISFKGIIIGRYLHFVYFLCFVYGHNDCEDGFVSSIIYNHFENKITDLYRNDLKTPGRTFYTICGTFIHFGIKRAFRGLLKAL